MAPKRAASPARKRAASPARAGSKHEAAPAFQEELHRMFELLRRLSGHAEAEGELPIEGLKEVLTEIKRGRAAGSGMSGARQIHAGRASPKESGAVHFPFIDVDPSDTAHLNFTDFADQQRKLLQATSRSFSDRKEAICGGISELEQLQRRRQVLESLRCAETVKELRDAITEAREVLHKSDAELVSQRERLATLEAPFSTTLSTLSGEQHEVEVTRTQSVGALRKKASDLFGLKPYRIILACSSARLEPNDALLEDCGITVPGMDIGVAFDAEDPMREMPFSRFAELLKVHHICDSAQSAVKYGGCTEDEMVAIYSKQLQAALEFDEQKQTWKEVEESEEEKVQELRAAIPPDTASGSQVAAVLAKYEDAIAQLEKEEASTKQLGVDFRKEAESIRREAQTLLDELMPEYSRYMRGVDDLTKEDIEELRCMAKPPELIMHVMKALCILFHIEPTPTGSKSDLRGFWISGKQQLLEDRSIIFKMHNYDKDCIAPRIGRELDRFVSRDELALENLRRVSCAAEKLSMFVHAMHMYYHTAQKVMPLKFLLSKSEERIEAQTLFETKRGVRLQSLQADVAKLRAQLKVGSEEETEEAASAHADEVKADESDAVKDAKLEKAAADDADAAKGAVEEVAADDAAEAKVAEEKAAADTADEAKGTSKEALADDVEGEKAAAVEETPADDGD